MSCFLTLYNFKDYDKSTYRPIGRALPIPFKSQEEAQTYLNEHTELWSSSPLFSYGTWEPTAEDYVCWDKYCKKIKIVNSLPKELEINCA